jgi:hypothetical protein
MSFDLKLFEFVEKKPYIMGIHNNEEFYKVYAKND